MDYISLKHDVTDLDKQVSDWKRKLELLQVCGGCRECTSAGGGWQSILLTELLEDAQ